MRLLSGAGPFLAAAAPTRRPWCWRAVFLCAFVTVALNFTSTSQTGGIMLLSWLCLAANQLTVSHPVVCAALFVVFSHRSQHAGTLAIRNPCKRRSRFRLLSPNKPGRSQSFVKTIWPALEWLIRFWQVIAVWKCTNINVFWKHCASTYCLAFTCFHPSRSAALAALAIDKPQNRSALAVCAEDNTAMNRVHNGGATFRCNFPNSLWSQNCCNTLSPCGFFIYGRPSFSSE